MGKELLLEIGTEEIPALFLPKALSDLGSMIRRSLTAARIGYGDVVTMATPRHLVLNVGDVAEKQTDQQWEKLGPSKKAAFDENGTPTKAAIGFAAGQGVSVADLEIVATEKGEYVGVRKTLVGMPTASLLPRILEELILTLPFPKSMRWGDVAIRFARPIHWILALFGGEVVPLTIGNVVSGTQSYGHRFMSPHAFDVTGFHDYLEKTRKGYVICDPQERRRIIEEQARQVASNVLGTPMIEEDLLEEVTFLVEYPVALLGAFNREFLALPREVLITCMMSHQKYFPVLNDAGDLLPHFIIIANTAPRNPQVVIKGNEKVIRARLTDAKFFFETDRKVSLERRVEELKTVVYHRLLGTSYEKVSRFRSLAAVIVGKVAPALAARVDRVAFLAKADLTTQMVCEFPELQGIMGREYAKLQGEDATIAEAISEHYLPIGASSTLPTTDEGAIVSIADKLDTICGFFGVGLSVTGTADPYALRRQALGIINIILTKGYSLDLGELIDHSLKLLDGKITKSPQEVKEAVLEFFKGRLENYLISQGYAPDVVQAVTAVGIEDLRRCLLKIKALEEFKADPSFVPLTVTVKRVGNIIKGYEGGAVDVTRFQTQEERDLWHTFREVKEKVEREYVAPGDYMGALRELASLREVVDAFFEGVMVMVDDEAVRLNRLSLLVSIADLFRQVADFSRLT